MKRTIISLLLIVCLLSCALLVKGSNNQAKAAAEQENDDFWNAIPTTTTTSSSVNDEDGDDILSTSTFTSDDEETVPATTTATPPSSSNQQQQQQTKQHIKSTTTEEDADEFDFNEDDFTSIQSKFANQEASEQQKDGSSSSEESNEKTEQQQPEESVRLFGLVSQEHYYYEMGFVAFILASGLIYLIGRSQGEKIFMKWAEKNLVKKILSKHFTKVNFMRDGANQYIIYATGNESIKHMTLKVTTPNKQDLLMGLLLKPIMGLLNGTAMLSQPEISLEMTLPRRFIVLFGMCEPKNYKTFLKQHEPLQLFTKHAQCDVNGKQLAVFTDTPSLITKIMSQSFVSYIVSDLLISDMLKPRIAGTNLVNCITLRTKIQFNKTLLEGDQYNSKNSKQSAKHENWLDELINFISFDFNLTQQENDKNIKGRIEVKENIEKEEKKQKLKEESKENRLKKLKGSNNNKKTK